MYSSCWRRKRPSSAEAVARKWARKTTGLEMGRFLKIRNCKWQFLLYVCDMRNWESENHSFSISFTIPLPQMCQKWPRNPNHGVQFTWPKNLLENRLRICLRLNFDSMACRNYLFLDFFSIGNLKLILRRFLDRFFGKGIGTVIL